jgi:hypothetical protein
MDNVKSAVFYEPADIIGFQGIFIQTVSLAFNTCWSKMLCICSCMKINTEM